MTDPTLSDQQSVSETLGLLRIEEVDTVGKSIAWLVQEMLLRGFDAIDHADFAARVALMLDAMPSGRTIILGMQFAIMEEQFAVALDHARLLVEREAALMDAALAARDTAATHP